MNLSKVPAISIPMLGTRRSTLHRMIGKTLASSIRRRLFSSSSSSTTETPSLYSFLRPSLFSDKPTSITPPPSPPQNPKTLTLEQKSSLESALLNSLTALHTDEAWKAFRSLTAASTLPDKHLTNSLITHLSSLHGDGGGGEKNAHNLKRAFASAAYVMEKNPIFLEFETVISLLGSMKSANAAAPALALVKCMFKNRYFVPFDLWGHVIIDICRKNGGLAAFLRVFRESCRIAVDEKLDFMKPDLAACNAALESCCRQLESVSDAESVVETMAVLGVKPDESSFGFLAYLFALKGRPEKINELENLMDGFGFKSKKILYCNMVSGYVKAGDLATVSNVILHCLKEEGEDSIFGEDTYCEVVKGFMENKSIKNLATLIIEAQKLESSTVAVDKSVGFGIINACVNLGFSDKAHSILDEMNARGGSVGLGVYVPILKAYCKEYRTAEATQLVAEITGSGLQLDVETYEALIEASMTNQDFLSAFTLFRDMREARGPDLKGSYLTIMTGLLENQRPELMAAFLDEVVGDPRVEVKSHDWNSIIHAFCKSGRLEDARRTFRRMVFLQFEPNNQTYLSLINGYVSGEKYFNVLLLWNEMKGKISSSGGGEGEGEKKKTKLDHALVDGFLYALVKGGFFDAAMKVVEKSQEMKIFVDKWRYKQAFMENHKKISVSKLRKRNLKKMEALIAFKNWAGLSS
ncbi:PREDICTED: pentatricopeptide repeat-containing protein At1g69290 [Tarenaya hassleriana]|uniref:pentatricopeptide repeat-containing protein At1g69290 n=1 Tax=Tarenaya hassleriana TaxID=28532 RepID=UPI00053CA104|nr:PREDICTED: pentatricopeptide repeat-containing protein At1g69290 [Tarenaya hassleriana]